MPAVSLFKILTGQKYWENKVFDNVTLGYLINTDFVT